MLFRGLIGRHAGDRRGSRVIVRGVHGVPQINRATLLGPDTHGIARAKNLTV